MPFEMHDHMSVPTMYVWTMKKYLKILMTKNNHQKQFFICSFPADKAPLMRYFVSGGNIVMIVLVDVILMFVLCN